MKQVICIAMFIMLLFSMSYAESPPDHNNENTVFSQDNPVVHADASFVVVDFSDQVLLVADSDYIEYDSYSYSFNPTVPYFSPQKYNLRLYVPDKNNGHVNTTTTSMTALSTVSNLINQDEYG